MALTPAQARLKAQQMMGFPVGDTVKNVVGKPPKPAAPISGYPIGGTPTNLANPAPVVRPPPQPAIATGATPVNLANKGPYLSPPVEIAPINPVPNTLPAVVPGQGASHSGPDLRIRPAPVEAPHVPGEVTRPFAVESPGVVQGGAVAPGRNLTVSTTPVPPPPAPPPSFAERMARPTPPPLPEAAPPTAGQAFVERMSRPAPPPAFTEAPPAAPAPTAAPGLATKAVRFLAGGAIPTAAVSLAAGVNAHENPATAAVSDDQIRLLAEQDPARAQLTFGKDRVQAAFAAPAPNPGAVKYGEEPVRNPLNDPPVKPSAAALTHKSAGKPGDVKAPEPAAPVTPLTPQQEQAAKFVSDRQAEGGVSLQANATNPAMAGDTFRSTRAITPDRGGSLPNDAVRFGQNRQAQYGASQKAVSDAQDASAAAQEQKRLSGGSTDTTGKAAQRLLQAEAANETARGRAAYDGPLERVTYRNANGEASGVREAGAQRGGFVGAATDAEAARNLQARAEQSAAAQQMISSMNAGAEAERDLRATKLGISRGTLDAMEGRGGSYASEGPMTVVGQEGVNFGDEAGRQSRIEGLINRAASETGGRTGSKRAEAMLGAAQALQAPGMERAKNDAELGKQSMASQATMNAAQTKANADLTTGRMKEVGDNYRAKLTYQGQTDAARIGQGGQDARLLFTEGKAGEREGAKALEARRTEGNKLWNAAVTPQGKGQYAEVNPGHAKQFFDQMDVDSVVEGMPGVSKETVQRWKRQDFLPNEVPTMKAWVQAWGQSQDPPGPNFIRNIPTAHDIMGIKRKPTE